MTDNFNKTEFTINKAIGRSDHLMLELIIDLDEVDNVKINKEMTYCFDKVKQESEEIKKQFEEAISGTDQIQKYVKLVDSLREKYKPKIKKSPSVYQWKRKIKRILDTGTKDWKDMANAIRNVNGEEYRSFLKILGETGIGKRDKEFFIKMRFWSDTNKRSRIMDSMAIEDTDTKEVNVETDRNVIDQKITEKYRRLLRDKGEKTKYKADKLGKECITLNKEDVENSLKRINLQKATSLDYIRGKVYELILKDREKDKDKYWKTLENIANMLTTIINSSLDISDKIFLSRLICLNKEKDTIGKRKLSSNCS